MKWRRVCQEKDHLPLLFRLQRCNSYCNYSSRLPKLHCRILDMVNFMQLESEKAMGVHSFFDIDVKRIKNLQVKSLLISKHPWVSRGLPPSKFSLLFLKKGIRGLVLQNSDTRECLRVSFELSWY